MENQVFGLPVITAVIVTGVPVVICLLLAAWGLYYHPERYESEKRKNSSTPGRQT